ncbi:VHS/ENTH/ANTH domain-containing protein [Facilibium subflavum]|uniref:hypothetical protein n=1 Tax=Facilibium subflavum TaxID=2219058 RepID=UPI000E64EB1E|nr:hypothetical protein [Facilibium subflavum]
MDMVKQSQTDKSQLKIHYYFNDDSVHTINAFTRNKAEKQLLDLISRVADLCKVNIIVDSQPSEKGSFVDSLNIIAAHATGASPYIFGCYVMHKISPAINNIITHLMTTKKWGKDKILERQKKEALIRKLDAEARRNNSETKKAELEIASFKQVLEDKKACKQVSYFYSEINKNNNISKVGIASNQDEEVIVEKKEFRDFMLHANKEENIYEDAIIEIISPVLIRRTGNFSWTGIFKDNSIRFKMSDERFKKAVYKGQYSFNSGTSIKCVLKEVVKLDEETSVANKRSFFVEEVLEVGSSPSSLSASKGTKKKKPLQNFGQQLSLFDEYE